MQGLQLGGIIKRAIPKEVLQGILHRLASEAGGLTLEEAREAPEGLFESFARILSDVAKKARPRPRPERAELARQLKSPGSPLVTHPLGDIYRQMVSQRFHEAERGLSEYRDFVERLAQFMEPNPFPLYRGSSFPSTLDLIRARIAGGPEALVELAARRGPRGFSEREAIAGRFHKRGSAKLTPQLIDTIARLTGAARHPEYPVALQRFLEKEPELFVPVASSIWTVEPGARSVPIWPVTEGTGQEEMEHLVSGPFRVRGVRLKVLGKEEEARPARAAHEVEHWLPQMEQAHEPARLIATELRKTGSPISPLGAEPGYITARRFSESAYMLLRRAADDFHYADTVDEALALSSNPFTLLMGRRPQFVQDKLAKFESLLHRWYDLWDKELPPSLLARSAYREQWARANVIWDGVVQMLRALKTPVDDDLVTTRAGYMLDDVAAIASMLHGAADVLADPAESPFTRRLSARLRNELRRTYGELLEELVDFANVAVLLRRAARSVRVPRPQPGMQPPFAERLIRAMQDPKLLKQLLGGQMRLRLALAPETPAPLVSEAEDLESFLARLRPEEQRQGGKVISGPAILRVGERPPDDPKYATDEYVFAPPGTIVAPRRKGERPTMTNALRALARQAGGPQAFLEMVRAQYGVSVDPRTGTYVIRALPGSPAYRSSQRYLRSSTSISPSDPRAQEKLARAIQRFQRMERLIASGAKFPNISPRAADMLRGIRAVMQQAAASPESPATPASPAPAEPAAPPAETPPSATSPTETPPVAVPTPWQTARAAAPPPMPSAPVPPPIAVGTPPPMPSTSWAGGPPAFQAYLQRQGRRNGNLVAAQTGAAISPATGALSRVHRLQPGSPIPGSIGPTGLMPAPTGPVNGPYVFGPQVPEPYGSTRVGPFGGPYVFGPQAPEAPRAVLPASVARLVRIQRLMRSWPGLSLPSPGAGLTTSPVRGRGLIGAQSGATTTNPLLQMIYDIMGQNPGMTFDEAARIVQEFFAHGGERYAQPASPQPDPLQLMIQDILRQNPGMTPEQAAQIVREFFAQGGASYATVPVAVGQQPMADYLAALLGALTNVPDIYSTQNALFQALGYVVPKAYGITDPEEFRKMLMSGEGIPTLAARDLLFRQTMAGFQEAGRRSTTPKFGVAT